MAEGTFTNFVTRNIQVIKSLDNSGQRIFEGHITVEVVDRQNEIVAVDQVLKAMENFMKVLPVLTDVHTNRVVGQPKSYEKSEIEGHPSVKIRAEIFKQEGVSLYDNVWSKIVKGEYTGLSMGGASKNRQPVIKDGRIVMKLEDLELYEIAVCPTPANQLALIKYVNEFAKAGNMMEKVKSREDGLSYIQCDSILCSIEKGEGMNSDLDLDIDNENDGKGKKLNLEKAVFKALINFNKPFADYENFAACVRANQDKGDPEAYCGEIKHKVEDVKKVQSDGTTRETQAEKDKNEAEYHEVGEKKKDELTEPVSQKDVDTKDLVYKCRDGLYKQLEIQILKNTLI